jgi:pimeloyl-ACP methyl ester carboxylesterase
MRRTLRLLPVVALVATSAALLPRTAAVAEVPCSQYSDSRLAQMTDDGIGFTSSLGLASGRYALPATPVPTQLVVMFHGHGNDSCSWRRHLQQVAARGAVGVAMDYTGQRQTPAPNYGWFVREGAVDSIAAAKHFLAAYPSITRVFAFGVSMGGNSSGLAVASKDAVRADGSPLFDYWVDIEGVNNLTEEYLVARGIAPVNSSGALAQREIEEENGGPIEAVPGRYADITNVARARDMKGLEGAVVVNGLDDGLVPTNQSPEMTAALTAVGVPTHQLTVVGRDGGESGTTATAIVAGPVLGTAGQQYTSPFAGHGWEGSDTQLVIKTGLDQLYSLMDGAAVVPGETVVPGA